MFDYRLDEEKSTNLEYIINYYVNYKNPNELLVEYADMDDAVVIDNSDENIEKLDRIMEEQMIRAIENREEFREVQRSIANGDEISIIVGIILSLSNLFDENIAKMAAFGLLVVAFPWLSSRTFFDCRDKIEEIDKAKFLLENMDLLMAYEEYSLPLIGVSKKCRRYLRGNDDPFKINDLDSFSMDDLKKMVHNMRKEDHFGFSYTKKYRR